MHLNNAMVVGPFVLPYSLLPSFAAVASTLYVGKRSGRKAGIDVESVALPSPMPVMVGSGGGDVFMPPGPAQAVARVATDKAINVRADPGRMSDVRSARSMLDGLPVLVTCVSA